MNAWKSFLRFLKQPKPWFLVVFYVSFAGILAALVCYFVGLIPLAWIGYALYFLSAITLAYFVYTLVILFPKVKRATLKMIDRHALTQKFVRDFSFRTIAFSIASFLIDLGYAVFEFMLALALRSSVLITLAIYYAILALLRGSVLLLWRKTHRMRGEGQDTVRLELKNFRNCGIALVLLSFTLFGAVVQMQPVNGIARAQIYVIALAAYSFYKISFAIVNFIRAKRGKELPVYALRNVNLITATVSMYVLTAAMLQAYSTDGGLASVMLPLGVSLLWAITVTVGILMSAYAIKRLKEEK